MPQRNGKRAERELQLDGMIETYGFKEVLHAMVEVCHRRTERARSVENHHQADDWQELCQVLTLAESLASHRHL